MSSFDRYKHLLQQLEHTLSNHHHHQSVPIIAKTTTTTTSSQAHIDVHSVITELVNASSPLSPLNLRLEILRGITHVISKYRLNLCAMGELLNKLWVNIRDLFDKSKQAEAKFCATSLMCAILDVSKGSIHAEKSGIVVDMFNVVKQVDNNIECGLRFNALRLITDNGSNLTYFPPDILVDTLIQAVQMSKQTRDFIECLTFMFDITSKNFNSLSEETVTKIIEFVARVIVTPNMDQSFVMKSLNIYDAIVRVGAIPPDTMVTFCSTMCHTVNVDRSAVEKGLEIMNTLLLSSSACHRAFQALIDIMNYSQVASLYRGAIFYVTMATWGKHSAEYFRDSFATVLYAMLKTMSYNIETVAFEVVTSLERLVRTYGRKLRIEWDVIIEMLMKVDIHFHQELKTPLKVVLSNTLEAIHTLYQEDNFFGNSEDYCRLMQLYKDICPTSVSIELLSDMQKRLHPAYMNWLSDLRKVLEDFFQNDYRPQVNEKVLEIVRSMLWKYSNISENSILDVLLPFFNHITNFSTPTIALKILELVIDVARELSFTEKRYDHLAQILYKSVVDGPTVEFRLKAISGMIDVFKVKFYSLPCNEALSIYGCLLKVLDHKEASIREKALDCLLSIRADHSYRLQLEDKVSPYLRCHSRNLIRTISFVLPVSNLVDSLLDRVVVEKDYHLFHRVIIGIRDILLNFFLLKEPPVWRVCSTMCNNFKQRFDFILGDDCRDTNVTTNGKHTGCAEDYIHVLRIIIGYNIDDILSHPQKQNLVDCFVFALSELMNCTTVNQNLAVAIVDSLTTCTAEMPEVVNNVFYSIFPNICKIKKIKAKQDLIISVLGFLNNMSRYAHKKLRHEVIFEVFEFVLTYTDSEKFPGDFIPMLTYRVLMSWFISCNFAIRQGVIKTCLPVLYKRMSQMNCTLAETAIDFFVKFAYLSCDQTLQMNEQMKKIFNNGPYQAWSTGNSILTAQAGHFNYIMLRYRRPTGTIAWTMKLVNSIRDRSSDESIGLIDDALDHKRTMIDPNQERPLSKSRSISSDMISQMVSESELSSLSSSAEIDSFLKSDSSRSLSPSFFDHENFMRLTQSPLPMNLNIEANDPSEGFDANKAFGSFLNQAQFHIELHQESSGLEVLDHKTLSASYQQIPPQPDHNYADGVGFRVEEKTKDILRQHRKTEEILMPSTDVVHSLPSYDEEINSSVQYQSESKISITPHDRVNMSPDRQPGTPQEDRLTPLPLDITSSFQPDVTVAKSVQFTRLEVPRPRSLGRSTLDSSVVLNEDRIISLAPRIARAKSMDFRLTGLSEAPALAEQQVKSTVESNKSPRKSKEEGIRKKRLKNIKDSLHLKISNFSSKTNTYPGTNKQAPSNTKSGNTSGLSEDLKRLSPSSQNTRLFEKEGALHPNFPYLFLRNWPFLSQEEPHGLQYSESLTRALNMIDYIPSVETAKFALLYVSEGQSTEQQILKNTFGSHRYFKFLQQIGDFVSLKDQQKLQLQREKAQDESADDTSNDSASFFSDGLLYTGGLDLSAELTDGEYALIYRDDICHVVFHAATMMPNLRHDEKFSNKKRHIGNDYVTIVYSDNDKEFNPNIITGQFNVVHIVIYPLEEGFNRVEVKFRDQSLIKLPNFGPLTKPQIVSDQALSSIVRLTAIHADLSSRAYRKSTGEFVSNWEERLRQIHVIKSRYAKPKTTPSADFINEDVKLINAMNDFFE